MIGGDMATTRAHMEYDERIYRVVREGQILSDILPDDYDRWLARTGSRRPVLQVRAFVPRLRNGLGSITDRLKRKQEKQETDVDNRLAAQEQNAVPS